MSVNYGLLSQTRHEDYDAGYWQTIRTLYGGAKKLKDVLRNPKNPIRSELFPRHLGEEDAVYEERCRRAVYVSHMTQLVDYILAVLFSDPISMNAGGDSEDNAPGSVDPFYEDFFKNTARPGSRPISFNQLLRALAKSALLFKRAWVLVDFPKKPVDEATGEPVQPKNRAEEQKLNIDRAYCLPIDPECVTDWEEDEEDGELCWAMVRSVSTHRATVEQGRNIVRETYTVYDRVGWVRFTWEWDTRKTSGPKLEAPPDKTESGIHSFGCVPLLPVELDEGLWAGGKLENIVIELFNKLSALSWSQYRSCFQILVANLSAPDPLNPITENEGRGVDQTVGPGRVMVLAEKDKFGFIGPDAAPFKEIREFLRELREDMHRVLHQMAQSVDNSAASVGRSGDSKKMDASSGAIVSKELGRIFRDAARDIYVIIGKGRKDPEKLWEPSGMETFDDVSLSDFIEEAATIDTSISIPAELFQILYKYDLARRILPGATDDQMDTIFKQLEKNITAESLATTVMRDAAVDGALNPDDPDGDGDDDSTNDPKKNPDAKEDKAEPKKKAPAPPSPAKRPKKTSRKRSVK